MGAPLKSHPPDVRSGSWLCENRSPSTHERFAKVARAILLLPAGDCFECFHTAWVNRCRPYLDRALSFSASAS
jgi:hypothetical protein